LVCTPLEFQKQVLSQTHTSNTNSISVKELFVEMTFYARLGYVQPPCCLHCTYTEYYAQSSEEDVREHGKQPLTNKNIDQTKSTSGQYDKPHKCHRYVIWRKDTNLPLHPDTIATNIVILPCYLVRQLLLQVGEKQLQNDGTMMMKIDESTKYQYDPIHKSITLK
jgi:hypothetical protein